MLHLFKVETQFHSLIAKLRTLLLFYIEVHYILCISKEHAFSSFSQPSSLCPPTFAVNTLSGSYSTTQLRQTAGWQLCI